MKRGSLGTVQEQVQRAQRSLGAAHFTDIDAKFRTQQIELHTTELATSDLDKYHKVPGAWTRGTRWHNPGWGTSMQHKVAQGAGWGTSVQHKVAQGAGWGKSMQHKVTRDLCTCQQAIMLVDLGLAQPCSAQQAPLPGCSMCITGLLKKGSAAMAHMLV